MAKRSLRKERQERNADRGIPGSTIQAVEFVQSAYNGGFPVPNENGFGHGQGVYVIDKKQCDNMVVVLRKWLEDYRAVQAVSQDCFGDDRCDCLYCKTKRAIQGLPIDAINLDDAC